MKSFFKKIIVALLEIEAKAVLKKYHPNIVAITGSVGKTTTKDAIYSVLAEHFFVRKSDKSFNSEIGVPLTILGLPNVWSNPVLWLRNLFDGLLLVLFPHPYPQWLVLEVGADRPGDIERVMQWIHPDISVVTRLSKVPVHVEFFDSPEAVRREKSFLVRGVKPTGTVILNADDEDVRAFASLTKARAVMYGMDSTADVRCADYQVMYEHNVPVGVQYVVQKGDERATVQIHGSLGMQHVYTTLAGCAVAAALNLPLAQAAAALADHDSPPGRMRILRGLRGSVLIDDTYNSSPVAAQQALKTLGDVTPAEGGRRIAVLGDMLELGEFSAGEHRLLGERAASVADLILTVGIRARGAAEEALNAGLSREQVVSFDDAVSAGEFLAKEIRTGDVVLLKGSQGVRLEKAVAQILSPEVTPEERAELLVRQDEEWQKR